MPAAKPSAPWISLAHEQPKLGDKVEVTDGAANGFGTVTKVRMDTIHVVGKPPIPTLGLITHWRHLEGYNP